MSAAAHRQPTKLGSHVDAVASPCETHSCLLFSPPLSRRSDLSHRVDRRIGVIDVVQIDHMRPSGVSGLYKRVGGLEKAQADQQAFRARYGVRQEFFDMVQPGHKGEGDPIVI